MSIPKTPAPAKLVIGLITADGSLMEPVARLLCRQFGPLAMVSPWLAFDYTEYYAAEMGRPLSRRMLVFRDLVDQGDLADIKCRANAVESNFTAEQGNRRINIDPGLLTAERFVLATGKNFAHRIYIGAGIFADLTLVYRQGGFRTLPWTYPDYAADDLRGYLQRVRRRYQMELKSRSLP